MSEVEDGQLTEEREHVLDETCWCKPTFTDGFVIHRESEMSQDVM